jgi:sigma-B regulation protein RsbU (phosphoserine phosphatase)
LNLAHSIQQSLLPPSRPTWPNLELVCYSAPAREVGGDLYAYHAFNSSTTLEGSSGRYAIAVGDVSGKGMPAALLMAVSLASFQSMVGQGLRPGEFLAYLDNALVPYTRTTRQNCALVYLEITPPNHSNQGILRVGNAGCVMPIIRRVDGQVEWIEVGGIPLGVGLGATSGYEEVILSLSKGDLIILVSDGVIEANNANHEMFSFDRLEQAVRLGPQTSAEAMLDHLKRAGMAFVGETEPHDDMTLVVVQM